MLHALLPETPWPLLILRAVVIYVFLMTALRLGGRRELGQMTSFDLILLLILANAVQNAMNAGDNSLGAGVILATTLFILNWLVGWAVYRWPWFDRLVEGEPVRIVTDGRIHMGTLRRERITLQELASALRKQGIGRISDCREVVLEPSGTLTAIHRDVQLHSLEELTHPDDEYQPDKARA